MEPREPEERLLPMELREPEERLLPMEPREPEERLLPMELREPEERLLPMEPREPEERLLLPMELREPEERLLLPMELREPEERLLPIEPLERELLAEEPRLLLPPRPFCAKASPPRNRPIRRPRARRTSVRWGRWLMVSGFLFGDRRVVDR